MMFDLKTDPTEFDAVLDGERTLDLVNANYGIGDLLCLREYLDERPAHYTGAVATVKITGVEHDPDYQHVKLTISDPLPDKT